MEWKKWNGFKTFALYFCPLLDTALGHPQSFYVAIGQKLAGEA